MRVRRQNGNRRHYISVADRREYCETSGTYVKKEDCIRKELTIANEFICPKCGKELKVRTQGKFGQEYLVPQHKG